MIYNVFGIFTRCLKPIVIEVNLVLSTYYGVKKYKTLNKILVKASFILFFNIKFRNKVDNAK